MPLSEQFQDDSVGGVNLGKHAGWSVGQGLTSNQWVIVFFVLAVGILFAVPRVFKGV